MVYGGSDGGGRILNLTVFEDKDWVPVQPSNDPPPARSGHCAWGRNGQPGGDEFEMYVFGGSANMQALMNDLWRFRPQENTWEEEEDGGDIPSPRTELAAAPIDNDTTIVVGGFIGTSFVNDTYIYEHPSHSWSRGPDLPRAESALSVTSWDGRVYVLAAEEEEVWTWSLPEEGWTVLEVSEGPSRRTFAATARLDARTFLLGGKTHEGEITAEAWSFNAITQSWTRLVDLPEPNYAGAAAALYQTSSTKGLLDALDQGTGEVEVYLFGGLNEEFEVVGDIVGGAFEPAQIGPSGREISGEDLGGLDTVPDAGGDMSGGSQSSDDDGGCHTVPTRSHPSPQSLLALLLAAAALIGRRRVTKG